MATLSNRKELIEQLQREILSMQGQVVPAESRRIHFGLGAIEQSFPNETFPTGAIHELISFSQEDAAATAGFMTTIAGRIMSKGGLCFWISTAGTIFPPALKRFGVDPERVVFVDVKNAKDLLWMIEEALKCPALSVVVGEVKELSLTESRRLQLAVEQSRVTGLMHRIGPRNMAGTATAARWQITSMASTVPENLPGLGFACWNVALLKVRNGRAGNWQIGWVSGRYEHMNKPAFIPHEKLINIA